MNRRGFRGLQSVVPKIHAATVDGALRIGNHHNRHFILNVPGLAGYLATDYNGRQWSRSGHGTGDYYDCVYVDFSMTNQLHNRRNVVIIKAYDRGLNTWMNIAFCVFAPLPQVTLFLDYIPHHENFKIVYLTAGMPKQLLDCWDPDNIFFPADSVYHFVTQRVAQFKDSSHLTANNITLVQNVVAIFIEKGTHEYNHFNAVVRRSVKTALRTLKDDWDNIRPYFNRVQAEPVPLDLSEVYQRITDNVANDRLGVFLFATLLDRERIPVEEGIDGYTLWRTDDAEECECPLGLKYECRHSLRNEMKRVGGAFQSFASPGLRLHDGGYPIALRPRPPQPGPEGRWLNDMRTAIISLLLNLDIFHDFFSLMDGEKFLQEVNERALRRCSADEDTDAQLAAFFEELEAEMEEVEQGVNIKLLITGTLVDHCPRCGTTKETPRDFRILVTESNFRDYLRVLKRLASWSSSSGLCPADHNRTRTFRNLRLPPIVFTGFNPRMENPIYPADIEDFGTWIASTWIDDRRSDPSVKAKYELIGFIFQIRDVYTILQVTPDGQRWIAGDGRDDLDLNGLPPAAWDVALAVYKHSEFTDWNKVPGEADDAGSRSDSDSDEGSSESSEDEGMRSDWTPADE